MTKEEYQHYLTYPEWAAKRLSIFKRDLFCCQKCGSGVGLNCHHKYYLAGRKPWQYPSSALVTLCENCHTIVHKTTKIGTKSKKAKSSPNIPKDARRKEKMVAELSAKERMTQSRYDNLKATYKNH